MENLQRQQAARLALEEKFQQPDTQSLDLRSMVETHIHQQALAFRHYQAAVRGAVSAGAAVWGGGAQDGEAHSSRPSKELDEEGNGLDEMANEEEDGEDDLRVDQHRYPSLQRPQSAPMHLLARCAESPPGQAQSQHHEWTYEEQFKQVRQTAPAHEASLWSQGTR